MDIIITMENSPEDMDKIMDKGMQFREEEVSRAQVDPTKQACFLEDCALLAQEEHNTPG